MLSVHVATLTCSNLIGSRLFPVYPFARPIDEKSGIIPCWFQGSGLRPTLLSSECVPASSTEHLVVSHFFFTAYSSWLCASLCWLSDTWVLRGCSILLIVREEQLCGAFSGFDALFFFCNPQTAVAWGTATRLENLFYHPRLYATASWRHEMLRPYVAEASWNRLLMSQQRCFCRPLTVVCPPTPTSCIQTLYLRLLFYHDCTSSVFSSPHMLIGNGLKHGSLLLQVKP